MTPRNLFRVVVATIGLIGAGYGILYLIDGLLSTLGQFEPSRTTAQYYAGRGIAEIVIGYLVMRNATPLAAIAFPDNAPIEGDDEENRAPADDELGPRR